MIRHFYISKEIFPHSGRERFFRNSREIFPHSGKIFPSRRTFSHNGDTFFHFGEHFSVFERYFSKFGEHFSVLERDFSNIQERFSALTGHRTKETDCEGNTVNELKKSYIRVEYQSRVTVSFKRKHSLYYFTSTDLKPFVNQERDKVSNSWINAIPLMKENKGFNLKKH